MDGSEMSEDRPGAPVPGPFRSPGVAPSPASFARPPAPAPGPLPGAGSTGGTGAAGGSGHPAVDAVLQALANAADLPPADQIAAYEAAHRALRETLATIDQA